MMVALVVLVVGISLLSTRLINDKGSNKSSGGTAEAKAENLEIEVEKKKEVVEEPFVNILDEDSSDITVTWDGPIEKSVYDQMNTNIRSQIDLLTAEGYTVGFMLYDLNTGGGISYHADNVYYSASAIKGPYVAWVAQTYPDSALNMYSTISNTITWSSNSDYFALISNFGKSGFDSWAAGLGSGDCGITDGSFAAINARDFARLWINMYSYFMSGDETAGKIRDLYSDTLQSCIAEALGTMYTVYSKAGWIGEGQGTYYNVQNDAGIVMKPDHPYVLVILSDAYGRLDLLDSLVACLDECHTNLTLQE